MLSLVQMTYKCKYCGKDFVREATLMSHMCEQKRRIICKDDKLNRIAYQSWLIFRRLSIANVKHDKPYEDFTKNTYFTGFMKLSKYMIDIKLSDTTEFVKYLITNSVKMTDWTKTFVLETFVKERLRNESVDRAIERSIIHIKEWSEIAGVEWTHYFQDVPTPQFVHDFKMGRISPWCLFATDQGSRLVDRLEPGQVEELVRFIEPQAWRARILRHAKDAQWVQEVFNKAEIV
jgi:hypothetical protein